VKAASDHKMKYQPEIALDADGDAFADATNGGDCAAFSARKGWVGGAEEKDGAEANPLEWLAKDARFKRRDVGGDVWELRH
jgi:hypothetical protein